MAARANFYAEQDTRNTTTTTWTDHLALTFTPEDNADYWVIWSAVMDASNASSPFSVRLYDETNAVVIGQTSDFTTVTSSAAWLVPVSGIGKISYGSSPGSQTIRIQFQRESGAGTIGCDTGRILLIKADAADAWVENTSTVLGEDTFTTACTLSFTPGSAGDYLFLFSGEYQNATSGTNVTRFKLVGGGVDKWESTQNRIPATAAWHTMAGMIKQASLSGAQTYTLQHRNSGGSGADINCRNSRILALRLDAFEAAQYAESLTRSTYATDTTDQDKATLTFTPAAVEHVVIGCALIDGSVTNNNAQQSSWKLKQDATVKAQVDNAQNSANDRIPCLSLYRATLAAASTDFKVSYATENTANTVGISYAAIAALQTGAAAASANALLGGLARSNLVQGRLMQ